MKKFIIVDTEYAGGDQWGMNNKELIPVDWIVKAFVNMPGNDAIFIEVLDPFTYRHCFNEDFNIDSQEIDAFHCITRYINFGQYSNAGHAYSVLRRLEHKLNGGN